MYHRIRLDGAFIANKRILRNMELEDAHDILWLRDKIERLERILAANKNTAEKTRWYQEKDLKRFKHILTRLSLNG